MTHMNKTFIYVKFSEDCIPEKRLLRLLPKKIKEDKEVKHMMNSSTYRPLTKSLKHVQRRVLHI